MNEQELEEMKQKVDYLDKMHKVAFVIIGVLAGIYLVKKLL